jgi:hemerythrin-like domain-containing protein
MMPVGPLMIEHRLIEKIIPLLEKESKKTAEGLAPNLFFIESAVDFFRMYADKTHHGKEEDILFVELRKKNINKDLATIMEELVNEHKKARELVGSLFNEEKEFVSKKGDPAKVTKIMSDLCALYPGHIEKEDKRFFIPCMSYFSQEEQKALLLKGEEFDKQMIHYKYSSVIEFWNKQ